MLADHTKFAKSGFIQVAAFRDVQDLVTDLPPPNTTLRAAAQWETRLHVVESTAGAPYRNGADRAV